MPDPDVIPPALWRWRHRRGAKYRESASAAAAAPGFRWRPPRWLGLGQCNGCPPKLVSSVGRRPARTPTGPRHQQPTRDPHLERNRGLASDHFAREVSHQHNFNVIRIPRTAAMYMIYSSPDRRAQASTPRSFAIILRAIGCCSVSHITPTAATEFRGRSGSLAPMSRVPSPPPRLISAHAGSSSSPIRTG